MLRNLKSLVAVAATALSLNTHAAIDSYLKLDGIPGESESTNHKGEIDVLSWSWGMSQSGNLHDGSGSGTGKASFNDISVTKWVDKSSVPMMQLVATGGHLDEAKLTVERAGEKAFIFEELVMYNVLVTSAATGSSDGEDRATENVTLNFEAFCITYTEQNPDGTAGEKPQLCFNIAENRTCSVAQTNTLYSLPLVMSLPANIRSKLTPVCDTT